MTSARAKSWRFYQGYLKKCGNVANSQVRRATTFATLRAGTIGVKVAIMPPGANLVDDIKVRKEVPVQEAPKEEPQKKQRTRRKKAEQKHAEPAAEKPAEAKGESQ